MGVIQKDLTYDESRKGYISKHTRRVQERILRLDKRTPTYNFYVMAWTFAWIPIVGFLVLWWAATGVPGWFVAWVYSLFTPPRLFFKGVYWTSTGIFTLIWLAGWVVLWSRGHRIWWPMLYNKLIANRKGTAWQQRRKQKKAEPKQPKEAFSFEKLWQKIEAVLYE